MASIPDGSGDMLHLGSDPNCARMMAKIGENFPDGERVVGSGRVVKINRKGKQQARALLISDKAVYNLMPADYSKCKRRIPFDKIAGITSSTEGDEFAIHVPEEYDYHFSSANKRELILTIAECYRVKTGRTLPVRGIVQGSLRKTIVTKDQARLQTREERMNRYAEFVNAQISDDDDDGKTDGSGSGDTGDTETINLLGSGSMSRLPEVALDDFEFLKVLGRGSFAKVMLVRKVDDGGIFAMKILKKKYLIQRHQVEHTIAERKILESLVHPFLMKLRFAFQTSGKLYFVLDYYQGGELFFHLKKKRRFSEEESRFFVAEVASALGHLHSMDVIYRDLKPENILLDHDGHICLTDFGLSKDVGDEPGDKMSHTFCGTPEYLAPEIILNVGHNRSVDWWSLGILLYELCVGIPPFYSQNVNEMYRKIREAPLLFPPNLSGNCKDVITRFLEREPQARLGSGVTDFGEIQSHPFFANAIDFDDLYHKRIDPPYKPNDSRALKTKNNLDSDTTHFDRAFTNEPVVDSYVDSSTLASPDAGAFDGFTFAGPRGDALAG